LDEELCTTRRTLRTGAENQRSVQHSAEVSYSIKNKRITKGGQWRGVCERSKKMGRS
jgi:hypothetical protein